MNRTLKVSLLCLGIFATGAIAGGVVALRHEKQQQQQQRMEERRARSADRDSFGPQTLRRFTESLELTEEQRETIRPIITQSAEELRRLRRESFKATTAVIEQMEAKVALELTEAQKSRLAEMQAKQRERMQRWMSDRQQRRPENRGPGGDRRRGAED